MRLAAILSLLPILFTACDDDPEMIIIPETRLMMYPPVGFKLDSAKSRFIRDKKAFLFMHGYDFSYNEGKNMLSNALLKTGGNVTDTTPVNINGYGGTLSKIKMRGSTSALNLVFGDSSFHFSLLGVYSSDDDDARHELMKSMMNCRYVKEIVLKEKLRDYQFDTSKSLYRKSEINERSVYYTLNGKKHEKESWDPLVILSHRPHNENYVEADKIGNSMSELIKERGFDTVIVRNKRYFVLNGYQAFELELHAKGEGQMCVYILSVSCPGTLLRMDCICYDAFEKNIEEFKKLGYSVLFKD